MSLHDPIEIKASRKVFLDELKGLSPFKMVPDGDGGQITAEMAAIEVEKESTLGQTIFAHYLRTVVDLLNRIANHYSPTNPIVEWRKEFSDKVQDATEEIATNSAHMKFLEGCNSNMLPLHVHIEKHQWTDTNAALIYHHDHGPVQKVLFAALDKFYEKFPTDNPELFKFTVLCKYEEGEGERLTLYVPNKMVRTLIADWKSQHAKNV